MSDTLSTDAQPPNIDAAAEPNGDASIKLNGPMMPTGYGGQVHVAEIAGFWPAMLQWTECQQDSPYDLPGKGQPRTVIVLRSGLKAPCCYSPALVGKLIREFWTRALAVQVIEQVQPDIAAALRNAKPGIIRPVSKRSKQKSQ